MNYPYMCIIFLCCLGHTLNAQTEYVRSQAKLKTIEGQSYIRHLKILARDIDDHVFLRNMSTTPGDLNNWEIFDDEGGFIRFHSDEQGLIQSGRASLGQQHVEVIRLQSRGQDHFKWRLSTVKDTVFLDNQPVSASGRLYRPVRRQGAEDSNPPLSMSPDFDLTLLTFRPMKTGKAGLLVQEKGTINEFPSLLKILGTMLATLELLDAL